MTGLEVNRFLTHDRSRKHSPFETIFTLYNVILRIGLNVLRTAWLERKKYNSLLYFQRRRYHQRLVLNVVVFHMSAPSPLEIFFYLCQRQTKCRSRTTAVTVFCRGPVFQQKPAIKQMDGGKKVLFECKIACDTKPQITWFRDTVELSDEGN